MTFAASPQPCSAMAPLKASHTTDILRLLDPAYSGQYNPSSSAVYVDANGDLHDPDFRHFPIHPPRAKARSASRSNDLSRPQWGLGLYNLGPDADNASIDEDDEPLQYDPYRVRHSTSRSRSDSVSSPYLFNSQSLSPYSPSGFSTSGRSDSILSSVESPFADEELDFGKEKRCPISLKKMKKARRVSNTRSCTVEEENEDEGYHSAYSPIPPSISIFSSPALRPSLDYDRDMDLASATLALPEEANILEHEQEEWTPTCTQALRHQWEAISLRVKFAVYRFRKRLAGDG